MDKELMEFGNWLLKQPQSKLYVDNMRLPMKDILKMYKKEKPTLK